MDQPVHMYRPPNNISVNNNNNQNQNQNFAKPDSTVPSPPADKVEAAAASAGAETLADLGSSEISLDLQVSPKNGPHFMQYVLYFCCGCIVYEQS